MDRNTPIFGAPCAVIDFETTGPDPTSCVPVSVAVGHFHLNARGDIEVDVVLNQIANPGIPIPEGAFAVHGISDETVRAAPAWLEVAPSIPPLLEDRLVYAYNAPFDLTILHRDTGLWPPFFTCGYALASQVDKYKRGKKLADVCGRRGVSFMAHDAREDIIAAACILPYLIADGLASTSQDTRLWPDEIRTVGGLTAWTLRSGLARDREYAAWCSTQPDKPRPVSMWERIQSIVGGAA